MIVPLLSGEKLTVTGHEEPTAIAPQLWLGTYEGSEEETELMCSGALPQLVTFTVLTINADATEYVSRQAEAAGVAVLILAININDEVDAL